MQIAVAWTAVALVALLFANWKESTAALWVAKPVTSAAFLYAGIAAGAATTTYGRIIFAALVLSFLGDMLLIPRGSSLTFRLGLLSFLLAHVAFASAFVRRGLAVATLGATVLGAGAIGFAVFRWLRPHLPQKMKIPVAAYVATIVVMVSCAVATSIASPSVAIGAGAVLFFASDLAVARERFISHTIVNKLWGLPLYYAAQLMLAFSISS